MSGTPLDRTSLGRLPAGIAAPGFDATKVTHGIVHIGLGGFHRAHMARYTHDLMNADATALDWGIVGVGLRDSDAPLLAALAEQGGLYTLVERENAIEEKTVIASIVRTIDASASSAELLATIDDPATRIVSMTVTENGYHLDRATKKLDTAGKAIQHDLAHPDDPRTVPGVLVEAYRRRRDAGTPAFTALSCDNIQHNGNVLRAAVLAFAEARDPALAKWIDANGSFPNTMVDRITPVPTPEQIAEFDAESGLDDKATLFSELFRQWVVEDGFIAGRPAWEKVGAQFVEDVTPYEFMKLRLLNGSHLAIAALGQLSGYETIGETIGDPLIHQYMAALMDKETGPTLMPVEGIDLADYKQSLLTRFANPAIRDTTQRVNTDAPVNVLVDPIRDRLKADESIDLLALGLAAWCRRVRGEDEAGQTINIVHPMADELREKAIGGGVDPTPILSIRLLFGDLGQNGRLIATVGDWLAALYRDGTKATIVAAAERGLF